MFSSKSTNGRGQSQRLPVRGADSRRNTEDPGMTDVHRKSSVSQGKTGDATRGHQDPRTASERQQRGNTSEEECPHTQRTQK